MLNNQTTQAKILLKSDPDKYKTLAKAEAEVQKNKDQNSLKGEGEKTPEDKIFDNLAIPPVEKPIVK